MARTIVPMLRKKDGQIFPYSEILAKRSDMEVIEVEEGGLQAEEKKPEIPVGKQPSLPEEPDEAEGKGEKRQAPKIYPHKLNFERPPHLPDPDKIFSKQIEPQPPWYKRLLLWLDKKVNG